MNFDELDGITANPAVMGGRPCIRGMRVTVGTVIGLLACGHSAEEILKEYPYLEADDIRQGVSVLQLRTPDVMPNRVAAIVVRTIKQFSQELQQGSIVSIDVTRARARILPFAADSQ